jgi:hypothetical protein
MAWPDEVGRPPEGRVVRRTERGASQSWASRGVARPHSSEGGCSEARDGARLDGRRQVQRGPLGEGGTEKRSSGAEGTNGEQPTGRGGSGRKTRGVRTGLGRNEPTVASCRGAAAAAAAAARVSLKPAGQPGAD